MMIVGCDLHTRYQQIAMLDDGLWSDHGDSRLCKGWKRGTVTKLSPKTVQNGQKLRYAKQRAEMLSCGWQRDFV